MEAPAAGLRAALVAAVVRRNDNALRALRDTDCDDAGADPMAAAERAQEEFDSAGWDVPRLVRVRVGIRRAARKYRKTKKKFDRAVVRAIRLQDLGGAREASPPHPAPRMRSTQLAFVNVAVTVPRKVAYAAPPRAADPRARRPRRSLPVPQALAARGAARACRALVRAALRGDRSEALGWPGVGCPVQPVPRRAPPTPHLTPVLIGHAASLPPY